jgi:hypothetical protein
MGGVDDRDWAKWTDDEKAAYLGSGWTPQPQVTGAELLQRIDSPYSSGVSLRVKVWGGLAAVIVVLAAAFTIGILAIPLSGPEPLNPLASWQPPVIYGWQHVPPKGRPNFDDPKRDGLTFNGLPVICTGREPDDHGRWACTEWTVIHAGQRVFVMPAESPLHGVACNVRPDVPCPGTAV